MKIFSSVNGISSALGAMLFLIGLYLVLEKGKSASDIIASVGSSGVNIFKTLQGR